MYVIAGGVRLKQTLDALRAALALHSSVEILETEKEEEKAGPFTTWRRHFRYDLSFAYPVSYEEEALA